METLVLCLSVFAVVLLVIAVQAWRLRNDRRDVWLMGTSGGALGVGAALAHWI